MCKQLLCIQRSRDDVFVDLMLTCYVAAAAASDQPVITAIVELISKIILKNNVAAKFIVILHLYSTIFVKSVTAIFEIFHNPI